MLNSPSSGVVVLENGNETAAASSEVLVNALALETGPPGGATESASCVLAAGGSTAHAGVVHVKREHPAVATTPTSDTATGTSSHAQTQYSAQYLAELLKDKKQLAAFPTVFQHLERVLDEEINKVRVSLFQFEFNKDELELPEADGTVSVVTEKVYVPVKDFPDYNFVGRILGPRGMTAKQLEQETGCKIMVRGRGSMRDKKKEDMNRGKPNWEHLADELHVLIQCEDTENRAKVKLIRAKDEVTRLLVPAAEGEDELKRKQLMELAIINGTYRPANQQKIAIQTPRLLQPMTLNGSPLRSPLGAPLILSPTGRHPQHQHQQIMPNTANLAQLTNAMMMNGQLQGLQAAQLVATSSPSAMTHNDQLTAANQLFFNQMLDPTMSALSQYNGYNAFAQPLFTTAQAQTAAQQHLQHTTPNSHDQYNGGQDMSLAGQYLYARR
jgi:protein quaking